MSLEAYGTCPSQDLKEAKRAQYHPCEPVPENSTDSPEESCRLPQKKFYSSTHQRKNFQLAPVFIQEELGSIVHYLKSYPKDSHTHLLPHCLTLPQPRLNSRLHVVVDGPHCPHNCKDLEGVNLHQIPTTAATLLGT